MLISVGQSPSPANYSLPSTVTKCHKSFGVGRAEYKKVVLKTSPLINELSPGPSAYSYESKIGKGSSKFTMRMRTKFEENITSKIVPGPGNYPMFSTINSEGKFRVSGFRDSGATKFSPKSSSRFASLSIDIVRTSIIETLAPGPGEYKIPQTLTHNGFIQISTYKSSGAPKISPPPGEKKDDKPLISKSTINASYFTIVLRTSPGPGAYQLPSDFGYCQMKFARTSADFSPKARTPKKETEKEEKADLKVEKVEKTKPAETK